MVCDSCIMPRFLPGPLAQSVEHLTFNQVVEGSNPSRPTIFSAFAYKLMNYK